MNPKRSRYYTYIRPIMNNKFAKTYSSLIFSLITISIFSYYAIRPTVTTILSLQKSIEEQNQVLQTVKEKVSNLVAGKQNLNDIPSSTRDKIDDLIPDKPDLPGLINSFAFVAKQSEASLSGIQFQPFDLEAPATQIVKDAPINEIEFTMNAQAEFNNLMKLLTALKRLDRLIVINSINFNQPPENNLIMSISGKAYYIKN